MDKISVDVANCIIEKQPVIFLRCFSADGDAYICRVVMRETHPTTIKYFKSEHDWVTLFSCMGTDHR